MDNRLIDRREALPAVLLMRVVDGLPSKLQHEEGLPMALARSTQDLDLPAVILEVQPTSEQEGNLDLRIGVSKLQEASSQELSGQVHSLRYQVVGERIASAIVGTIPRWHLRYLPDEQALRLTIPALEAGAIAVTVQALDRDGLPIGWARAEGSIHATSTTPLFLELSADSGGVTVDLGSYPYPRGE